MRRIKGFPTLLVSLISLSLFVSNVLLSEVQVPYSPSYDPSSQEASDESWPPGLRAGRAMYLSQGVEFVFPIGVQYTLANANEQIWPIGTTGFDTVLEFPKNKIAIMFSSMVNTLKIANFTISSRIYTNSNVEPTTALRILGTDIKPVDFKNNYKEAWTVMNRDISGLTGGSITEFIPKGKLYGRSIYPFTTATYINTVHYENHWAFPWKPSLFDKFTDSPKVPYLEVEGLMPYYENDAFIAVAALFKSGTGSVVFLKPKGNITILQLMLNPTALTQIFDENFPGWGVKQMRVRIPEASFTTNSQHYDMLVKRGVSDSFCVHESPNSEPEGNRFFLNPIVQTNHIKISKDIFRISSVTGVTLNNEKDQREWNSRLRDSAQEVPAETLLEEYTTPKFEEDSTSGDDGVVLDDEGETTISPSTASEDPIAEDRKDLPSLTFGNTSSTSAEDKSSETSDNKTEKKGPTETFTPPSDLYEFNEPFLWFLHAINEEPMFMGVIESFKRYMEETGNMDNNVGSESSAFIEKNGWLYEATKGAMWHCPSLINKQTE